MPIEAMPTFWRDAELPFIEARQIEDGRKVFYGRHSHEVFSIGAVTSGQSTYLHEKSCQTISAGTVVLMNPGEVHACNPIEDQPWSYVMLYVDANWLAGIQHSHDDGDGLGFQPISATHTRSSKLFAGLIDLYAQLIDPALDALPKREAAVAFFMLMQRTLGHSTLELKRINPRVVRAAEYINEHFMGTVRLAAICKAANLSEAYLIRAFEQQYHMTPHAYLINRRIQHAQAQLRDGASIIDIAHEAGFADQAHFQRVFKKHLAATPGQYKP
ncbi:AraC family transcriptional regulator [Pseudomonas sp. MH10]|uniref:AraC family transcriptional regulator n=1 Tax=Pseudomonas sp. MH10 TaxID=3048627 RepID=UPI002AC8C10A|nr:AraC family transcriptional regulator [Pseudomonas sp. MH10]MEB0039365.1 AraC family transcriptional regulator [Pseudomonas sp. MH10]WPX62308.1 AraC family transcriptional regulator [Pseudomonas sp. MH10]